ncbi:hypothetical protein LVD56_004893, partial [Escherichia coli]|nr:hypothetical protein [Escherichia coli]
GNITINGTSQGLNSVWGEASFGAGIAFKGNTNFSATYIVLNGTNTRTIAPFPSGDTASSGRPVGIIFCGTSNTTFTGNTTINASSEKGAGIAFLTSAYRSNWSNLTFNNGTAIINATTNVSTNEPSYYSAISFYSWTDNIQVNVGFTLNNSNLTINASAQNSAGVGGWQYNTPENTSFLTLNGTGNVNITGSGKWGGVTGLRINNTGLNGTTVITGSSSSGQYGSGDAEPSGVYLKGSSLTNTTITGSATGCVSGVIINGNSTLINTTVNGTAVNGTGV